MVQVGFRLPVTPLYWYYQYVPMSTPEAQREYQRQWIQNRRDDWIQRHGPCVQCGSWDSLAIDHIDPKTKTMDPRAIWSRREEIRKAELEGCQVLCRSCHLEKTIIEKNDHSIHLPHGLKRYKNKFIKCRCDICKSANAFYEANRRKT